MSNIVKGMDMIMKNKISKYFIIIGIIAFVLGFYSMFFKAGLPYQDTTAEMLKKWLFYYKLGKLAMLSGIVFVLIGAVSKILIKLKQ